MDIYFSRALGNYMIHTLIINLCLFTYAHAYVSLKEAFSYSELRESGENHKVFGLMVGFADKYFILES